MGSKEKRLEAKISDVKSKLSLIGELYPGRISKQYNICGNPSCRCKDKENPRKHGPYANLSFTFSGKGRTKFIRKDLVADFMRYTANYKDFRKYSEQLIKYNIELINLRSESK